MKPEDILAIPPQVLSQKQREFYFENGYLLLEKIVPDEWLDRLRQVTDEMVERSREVETSNSVWDVDDGHSRRRRACAGCRAPTTIIRSIGNTHRSSWPMSLPTWSGRTSSFTTQN
jgi:hypothetical protein